MQGVPDRPGGAVQQVDAGGGTGEGGRLEGLRAVAELHDEGLGVRGAGERLAQVQDLAGLDERCGPGQPGADPAQQRVVGPFGLLGGRVQAPVGRRPVHAAVAVRAGWVRA